MESHRVNSIISGRSRLYIVVVILQFFLLKVPDKGTVIIL